MIYKLENTNYESHKTILNHNYYNKGMIEQSLFNLLVQIDDIKNIFKICLNSNKKEIVELIHNYLNI